MLIIALAFIEELNEEDQNLKTELEMLVERLKVRVPSYAWTA